MSRRESLFRATGESVVARGAQPICALCAPTIIMNYKQSLLAAYTHIHRKFASLLQKLRRLSKRSRLTPSPPLELLLWRGAKISFPECREKKKISA